MFCVYLLSLGIFPRFTHVEGCLSSSFLFIAEHYCIIQTHHDFDDAFICAGLLGCLHFLAMMNNAAMNICVLCVDIVSFLLSIYSSEMQFTAVYAYKQYRKQ